jgi:hypothetical protein
MLQSQHIVINPFTVHTPEDLLTQDVIDLFVEGLHDFTAVEHEGHTIVEGARGCGKSMMFRFMQPDCQCIRRNCSPSKLPYYAVHVHVKKMQTNITELDTIQHQLGGHILNEHFLTLMVLARTFNTVASISTDTEERGWLESAIAYYDSQFIPLLKVCGYQDESQNTIFNSVKACFTAMEKICTDLLALFLQYVRRFFPPRPTFPSYEGPLCGFIDFVYPLLNRLRELPFMPKVPIFLLIDDADNLSLLQTQILNTWLATRTSNVISIKVSTQLEKYKTYRTIAGSTIDSPHDYQELNISDRYTSTKNLYMQRVRAIVQKRFALYGIKYSPDEFFPVYQKQQTKIEAIASDLREKWSVTGHGYRPGDDSIRYATPIYMKSLTGSSKSGPTYMYAGFEQLVHISSGVVRYFLEAAARMYAQVTSRKTDAHIRFIPPIIQHRVVFDLAVHFLITEFDKHLQDLNVPKDEKDERKKLQNLLEAMGATFRAILLSERSERRVFSIALSGNNPSDEIANVLRLGVQEGYLQKATIGNKEGTGRTALYILSRRLAPYYKLDPTSFAGYLFVTNEALLSAIYLRKPFRMDDPGIYQLTLLE